MAGHVPDKYVGRWCSESGHVQLIICKDGDGEYAFVKDTATVRCSLSEVEELWDIFQRNAVKSWEESFYSLSSLYDTRLVIPVNPPEWGTSELQQDGYYTLTLNSSDLKTLVCTVPSEDRDSLKFISDQTGATSEGEVLRRLSADQIMPRLPSCFSDATSTDGDAMVPCVAHEGHLKRGLYCDACQERIPQGAAFYHDQIDFDLCDRCWRREDRKAFGFCIGSRVFIREPRALPGLPAAPPPGKVVGFRGDAVLVRLSNFGPLACVPPSALMTRAYHGPWSEGLVDGNAVVWPSGTPVMTYCRFSNSFKIPKWEAGPRPRGEDLLQFLHLHFHEACVTEKGLEWSDGDLWTRPAPWTCPPPFVHDLPSCTPPPAPTHPHEKVAGRQ